jgi:hypothetical protein
VRGLLLIATALLLAVVLAPAGRSASRVAAPARYTITHGRLVAVEPTGLRVKVAAIGVVCDRARLTAAGKQLVYRGRFCAGAPIDVALNHARLV